MTAELRKEATTLGRYLVDDRLTDELIERYVAAHQRLLPSTTDRVSAFGRRYPISVPCLDAAAGLVGRHCDFRKRVLLMTVILEASPEFADKFLPAPRPWAGSILELGWTALRALTLGLIGTPLYLMLRRHHQDER
jgi:hypothetical protein